VAFAGGEAFPSTAEEIIDLTETSEVVDFLLQLMSLEKHPNLMTLEIEFSVLAQLADAIEKYEVVSAMNICDMAMRFVCCSSGHLRNLKEPFQSKDPQRSCRGGVGLGRERRIC
jgi:hypothetical protein